MLAAALHLFLLNVSLYGKAQAVNADQGYKREEAQRTDGDSLTKKASVFSRGFIIYLTGTGISSRS